MYLLNGKTGFIAVQLSGKANPISDPSIRAIILKIDGDRHEIVIEELDENHLLVKESKLPELKAKLEKV